jgi:hypothetical protein
LNSKIIIMRKKINIVSISALALLLFAVNACRKGDFDINSPNPNTPSSVPPNFVLSAALTSSDSLVLGGNADFLNTWMGYWAVYGITSSSVLTYNITNDFFPGNWDRTYIVLENYKFIEDQSGAPSEAYFLAIAKIMKAFHYQRLVDLYNNIPYSQALSANNNFPKYDDASAIYKSLVLELDSSISIIDGAPVSTTDNPGENDVMFQGNMDSWVQFANTLKLKILLRLTGTAGGTTYIQANLNGLTTADFLGAGEDAAINPGYSNASQAQQSPLWQDVGYSTNGSPSGNNQSYRANSYAVNFYLATNDTFRLALFYAPNDAGIIKGRAFGSSDVGQSNSIISGIGSGILSSPGMSGNILPAFESLFLQAEAAERGLIPGDPATLFKSAVSESFRLLGVADYANNAQSFYSQPGDQVNIDGSANKINTIILQKWAALNAYDPLESYSDWRRLGIPADLPVSVYPGTTAAHIPYRLLYPTSEFQYNAANVNAQGKINQFTSKIFWMP